MDNEIKDIIKRYIEIKSKEASSPELIKIESVFTQYYWDKVFEIICRLYGRENRAEDFISHLDIDTIIFIDFGMIDISLIENKDIKEVLINNRNYSSKQEHILYFSEWLRNRISTYNIFEVIKQSDADYIKEINNSTDKENLEKLIEMRTKIYEKLKIFITTLPGLPENISNIVISGQLDKQLENISLECLKTRSVQLLEQRNKIALVREGIIRKLRDRLQKHKFFPLVDALNKIEDSIWRLILKTTNFSQKRTIKTSPVKKDISSFIKSEINIIKSLVPIAGIEGKKFRTTPILCGKISDLISKKDVEKVIELIYSADFKLPGNPNILIAPAEGSGFFEWDRDTLFIPLRPTINKEEAIVNAVANYRLLTDTQGDKVIKEFYLREFNCDGPKLKNTFIKDYKDWILKVGRGKKGVLNEKKYNFFKEIFAPDTTQIIGPRFLLNLSAYQQEELFNEYMNKAKSKKIKAKECYEFGVLYWLRHDLKQASRLMEVALRHGYKEDIVLISLGALYKQMLQPKTAINYFRQCQKNRNENIWYIIASDELEKMG